jgi:hypothetical protein
MLVIAQPMLQQADPGTIITSLPLEFQHSMEYFLRFVGIARACVSEAKFTQRIVRLPSSRCIVSSSAIASCSLAFLRYTSLNMMAANLRSVLISGTGPD